MSKIIRTPTRAEGGITPEEKIKLDAHAQLWIKRIMRTEPIDPKKIVPAIERLYELSGLKKPKVIIVPSPLVGRLASGLACSILYQRKTGEKHITYAAADAATDDATYAATHAATYDATYAAADAATRAATYDATYDATYAAADAATRAAADAAADAATDDATRAATRAVTYDATYDVTYDATYDATYAATRAATYAATRAAADAAADAATDDATRAATRAVTYDATYDATYAAADAATRAAADAAADAATDDATQKSWLLNLVRSFTPNTISFSLRCINLSWKLYQGGNMWGYYDSYLTAFRDVLGLKLPIHEKFSAWEECAIEGGFRYMHEDFCMVSDFPEILLKDEQNRPHCSTGPSHRWRDGFEIYHLHGIRFKKEEWDKWRYSDAQTILKIENTDKRAVLIAEVGAEKILADCQSEIIGTDEFGEVLELKGMKDGNGSPYRFLKAMDPAHQQFVYLRIPPTIDKPRDAEAWTYGVDAYNPIVRV